MTSSLLQNPKCVGLSLVINVLLIISSAVVISLHWEIINKTVFSSPHSHRAIPMSDDDDESNTDSVCVSCDYLGEQVRVNDTEYADIVKTNCGNKLCCLNDREIQHFLKAIVNGEESRSPSKLSLEWWRNRPNSAHFYLNRSNPIKDNRLQWTASDPLDTAFTQNIGLHHTNLTVRDNGFYFVYATTTFTDMSAVDRPFYLALECYSPPKHWRQLLFDKFSGEHQDKQQTNSMAGMFLLSKESVISVSLMNANRILDTSSIANNYIGIYKLHV